MKKVIFLLLPVLFLSLVSTAGAALISIDIEGTVTSVIDDGSGDGWLDGKINIGDPVIGTYTYDTLTADTNPSSEIGNYDHYNSPCGIFVNVGGSDGLNFQTDPDNVNFLLSVGDNYQYSDDAYKIISYSNLSLPNGTLVDVIGWQLDDPSGTALSSDELPLTAPDLNQWQSAGLTIRGEKSYDIGVDITSVQLVPEPATFLVLLSGLIFLRKNPRH